MPSAGWFDLQRQPESIFTDTHAHGSRTVLELAEQQDFGKRLLDMLLDDARHRSRPHLLIVTASHEPLLGRVVDLDPHLAPGELGLQFVEKVTDWKANEKLGFSIEADPKATPLTTLDEHVTVGGAFFDVLSGTYEIHRLNARECELVLYSQHRISTHFNFYARLWSRYLMSEIQWNILQVIKQRAEKEKA